MQYMQYECFILHCMLLGLRNDWLSLLKGRAVQEGLEQVVVESVQAGWKEMNCSQLEHHCFLKNHLV